MITGFEEYTKDLDQYEMKVLLPAMVNGMKTKLGERNAISATDAIKKMKEAGMKISGPRFRKIMHVIRVSGMVKGIVGTSKGYFIANTYDEWTKYLNSINERLTHIKSLRDAITDQYDDFKRMMQ